MQRKTKILLMFPVSDLPISRIISETRIFVHRFLLQQRNRTKKCVDRTEAILGIFHTNKALTRLSAFLPPGLNLTAIDVRSMQNLCPYETAALGSSSFCSLFTEQEWRDYAYTIDLKYYSDCSFSSPTGRVYGIGYVLGLAARLQSNLISFSINSTYDDNTPQFPCSTWTCPMNMSYFRP